MSVAMAGIGAAVLAYLVLEFGQWMTQRARVRAILVPGQPRPRARVPRPGDVWRAMAAGDLPLRVIQGIAFGTVALFASGLALRSFALIFVAALFGVVTLYAWAQRRRWSLAARLERQLPEAMDVMANALSAGATVFHALEVAAEETRQPLRELLERAVARCRVNQTAEESLRHLRDESGSDDVGTLVATLAIQRTTGGNLARLLRESAEFLREQQRLRADARALSAQARYSAQMIGVMPVGLFALFYAFFPGYVEPLTSTTVGLLVLFYCAMSVSLGWYVIWRIAAAIEHA